jgi:hypothetical protein
MRGTFRTVGLVTLVAAGGLLTAGTASAAPGLSPAQACDPQIVSRDVPTSWIPRSPSEQNRRITWDQISKWDADRDDHLSDQELDNFRNAAERIPGGPDCSRPADPPR